MASESSGTSYNTAQSTSTPVTMNSAQTDWGLLQSQLLTMLANQTQNWAMQQYAKGEQVSDQTIANFMEMSGKGKGLADTLLHQYQDQVKPLYDKYLRDAGSYASEGRQAFEAGKAMSTVGQADRAAMEAIERKLEATGINVNSGRIQEQMIAARTADAAARAGAGTKAAQDTEAIGRQMQEKALAMGQQMPGQAVNAIQSSYAGLTGAENAILGLLNTGKNLAEAAVPYHNAAVAANKIPPVANASQSTSQGGSQQSSRSTDPNKQEKEQGEKGPGQGKGDGAGKGKGDGGGGEGKSRGSGPAQALAPPPAKIIDIPPKEDDGTGAETDYTGPTYISPEGYLTPEYSPGLGRDPATGDFFTPETANWEGDQSPNWTLPENYNQDFNIGTREDAQDAVNNIPAGYYPGGNAATTDWADPFKTYGGTTWEDLDRDAANAPTDVSSSNRYGDQDFANYNNANDDDTSYPDDPFAGDDDINTYDDDPGSYDDSGDYDFGGSYDDAGGDSYDDSDYYADDTDYYGGGDTYDGGYDGGNNSYYAADDSYDSYGGGYDGGGSDTYDSGGDGGDGGYGYDSYEFARGGRVPQRPRPQQRGVMPTTGGAVPRSASPSRGRQTDDISARLNAGEYVIPRDVVKHQGTKFFSDLIAKSRKLRTGMAGAAPKPTMRPALPQGPPAFRSRPLPPR